MRALPAHRIVDVVVLVFAGLLLVRLVGIWVERVPHPFDLEWMEGGMLAHAWRLQHGLPLYPEPGPDFAPFVYPPGYSSVLALLGYAGGLDHGLGRALSLASSLGAAAALVVGVRRQGADLAVSVAAGAVFLGCYTASGAFYDVVRPDAMATCLLGWSLIAGLERGRPAVVAAGLLLAAAWVTKHNAAAYGLAMCAALWVRDGWKGAFAFAFAAAAPALLLTGFLQAVSSGRFLVYILGVPGSHPMVAARAFPGVPAEVGSTLWAVWGFGSAWLLAAILRDLPRWGPLSALAGAALGGGLAAVVPFPSGVLDPGLPLTVASAAALGAVVFACAARLAVARQRPLSWTWVYLVGALGTAATTAALMRAHHGGFLNVLIPFHWCLCLCFGVALARWRASGPGWATSGLAAALVVGQLGWLASDLDPRKLVPDQEDLDAGAKVVDILRHCESPVLSPFASWLPAQAGHPPSRHLITVWDLNHHEGPLEAVDTANLEAASEASYWGCVVHGNRVLGFGIDRAYPRGLSLQLPGRALMPRTGWRVRPTSVTARRPR